MLAIDKQTLPCANETELMQLLYTMLDRKRFGMVYDEATAEQREDLMRELEHAMQTTKHLAGHLGNRQDQKGSTRHKAIDRR